MHPQKSELNRGKCAQLQKINYYTQNNQNCVKSPMQCHYDVNMTSLKKFRAVKQPGYFARACVKNYALTSMLCILFYEQFHYGITQSLKKA